MRAEDTAASADGAVAAAPPAIELRGVNKHFGPVHANSDISLEVAGGTIHGIIGENGAGKSTLMSILYGFYRADSGEVRALSVKVGDRILFSSYAGTEIKYEGDEYLIMREEDILGIIG